MQESTSPPSRIADRFQQTGPSSAETWAKLRALAGQPGIINLGQGFPDFTAIPNAITHAKHALDQVTLNQYAPMGGAMRLKQVLSKYYGPTPPRHTTATATNKTHYDPATEITATNKTHYDTGHHFRDRSRVLYHASLDQPRRPRHCFRTFVSMVHTRD